jgi:hypothetical protein
MERDKERIRRNKQKDKHGKESGFRFFLHCPSSGILKNATFWKLDLLPSLCEGWKAPALLGVNLNHWTTYISITTITGVGQNNGNTKKLSNMICLLASLKELQMATLNIHLPFVYNL